MDQVRQIAQVVRHLSEANRFKVLCHARMLLVRQCLVNQYYLSVQPDPAPAHWVGLYAR